MHWVVLVDKKQLFKAGCEAFDDPEQLDDEKIVR